MDVKFRHLNAEYKAKGIPYADRGEFEHAHVHEIVVGMMTTDNDKYIEEYNFRKDWALCGHEVKHGGTTLYCLADERFVKALSHEIPGPSPSKKFHFLIRCAVSMDPEVVLGYDPDTFLVHCKHANPIKAKPTLFWNSEAYARHKGWRAGG